MKDKIAQLELAVQSANLHSKEALEEFRLKFLSKNGALNDLMADFKQIEPSQKKELGQLLNQLKSLTEGIFKKAQEELENKPVQIDAPYDLSLPIIPNSLGSRHPLNLVREQIAEIFERIGFSVADGPEIEDDWHNFGALNFAENHPARDMQDTFFLATDPQILLRTHTSSVQVRLMEKGNTPIRAIMPGRVYRNEAISARAHCLFHQIEGIYIDRNVSFADLKETLYYFVQEYFGKDIKIRFRPSYFPFTEPSAEIDISCLICKGEGCNVCKHSGWVEIGGSGMVHPNVLSSSNIDPKEFTGFAFGMGIERITMLKYQIKDLRLFTENDVRFLKQFAHL